MTKDTNYTWQKNVLDEPTLVGFVVLSKAKQPMLDFCYDFLRRITRPQNFRAIEMGTVSFYIAPTENSLYERFIDLAETEMKKNGNF